MSYAHTECAAVFSENSSTLLRTHHPKCQLCWDENASDIYGKKKSGTEVSQKILPKCPTFWAETSVSKVHVSQSPRDNRSHLTLKV